jgi:hypothetical protein
MISGKRGAREVHGRKKPARAMDRRTARREQLPRGGESPYFVIETDKLRQIWAFSHSRAEK